jgi:putative colanic acid biosynthesis acetyltransferase WcaF
LRNRAGRVAWGVVYALIFRNTPRPLHRVRNLILRAFGASLHPTARVYPKAKVWAPWNLEMDARATLADDVDCYCVDRIRIGARTTVSQYSYLCGATHDHEDPEFPLLPLPIMIGSDCWIAADCFIAPGVTMPDGVVVGARSGVFKDPPAWTVIAGTPATVRGPRTLKRRTASGGVS